MQFLVTFAAVIVVLTLSPGVFSKTWPTALIHNEEVTLEYFAKTQQYPGRKSLERYKNLDKKGREKICSRYLGGATSSFSKPDDKIQYADDAFKDSVQRTFQANENAIIENFTFETSGGPLEAPAHACIVRDDGESWNISPGFHKEIYFAFNKPADSPEFRLFGMIEEIPRATNMIRLASLEKRYVTGKMYDWNPDPDPEDKKNVRNLCSLNMNERFRLCATALLADRHGEYSSDHKYKEGFFVSQDIPENYQCIKSTVTISVFQTEEKVFPADIVPCAFNNTWKYAEIFLTNDPHSSTSLFALEAVWEKKEDLNHTIYDPVKGFVLEDHLTNVACLKSFQNGP